MKRITLFFIVVLSLSGIALAGTSYSGKEMKQTVAQAPCTEWYGDTEWNVSMWGAYAFTGTESNRAGAETADDEASFGEYDRFLGDDHAWGGGMDFKYFFHRYFGVGIEGFALAGHGTHLFTDEDIGPSLAEEEHYEKHDHVVGGVLGTFTFRYPIPCSRFAPYVFAGAGGIFGGHNDKPHSFDGFGYTTAEDESKFFGQFGGGFEVRITRSIGWISDFSWNAVEGPHNDFGMVRTGINFAF